MDIKNIVSIDDENIWKSDHTSNPYAIVLNAKKIWKFTKHEWPEKYKFYAEMIKENATNFIMNSCLYMSWMLNIYHASTYDMLCAR